MQTGLVVGHRENRLLERGVEHLGLLDRQTQGSARFQGTLAGGSMVLRFSYPALTLSDTHHDGGTMRSVL
jgi:hypothetical protein